MQLTVKPIDAPSGILTFLVSLLPYSLREHMKRTIFVFSVLAVLDQHAKYDSETVRDINGRLKLARTEGICKTSIRAHRNIWGHTSVSGNTGNVLHLLTTSTSRLERNLLSEYYVRHCPDWLRYGDSRGSDMARDLHRLFDAILVKDL